MNLEIIGLCIKTIIITLFMFSDVWDLMPPRGLIKGIDIN